MNSNISVNVFLFRKIINVCKLLSKNLNILYLKKKKERKSNQIQLFSAGFSNLNVTDALLQLKEASIVFLL